MNAMYIYTYCMVCYVLVYLGYDELYLFPYVYTYICLSYVILDCIYLYIYMLMHIFYIVKYMLMCMYVLWIWIELYLMWTGLTQIDDINNCETQLTLDTGTQWHCMCLLG